MHYDHYSGHNAFFNYTKLQICHTYSGHNAFFNYTKLQICNTTPGHLKGMVAGVWKSKFQHNAYVMK